MIRRLVEHSWRNWNACLTSRPHPYLRAGIAMPPAPAPARSTPASRRKAHEIVQLLTALSAWSPPMARLA